MLFVLAALAAACVNPDSPAAIVRAAPAELPPGTRQAGFTRPVQVTVQLDEAGRLRGARIASSPSPAVNAAALDAARHSTFRTAVHDCRPLAASLVMSIGFGGSPGRAAAVSSDGSVTTVDAEGSASAPPDVALAHIEFATRAADPNTAIAQNDALADRYRAALRAIGVEAAAITGGYYDVLPASSYAGQSGGGYFATHELIVTTPVVSLQPIFDAAARSGATAGSVAYDVVDHRALYDAAMVAAMRDAVLRTDRVASEQRLHRSSLVRSQTTFTSSAPLERVTFAPAPTLPVVPPAHPVELRVRVAVTYALQPD